MPKKTTKPGVVENPPNANSVKSLAEKIDRNPLIKFALQEAMKKGKARRRGMN